jgi:predicted acyl esterase
MAGKHAVAGHPLDDHGMEAKEPSGGGIHKRFKVHKRARVTSIDHFKSPGLNRIDIVPTLMPLSARHLDGTLSTDDVPAHSFDRVEKLSPGEIAEIEIELLPIGLVFHSGEQLRFVIGSRNLLGTLMPGIQEYVGANSGRHVIHTGGGHPSYLQLPIQAR